MFTVYVNFFRTYDQRSVENISVIQIFQKKNEKKQYLPQNSKFKNMLKITLVESFIKCLKKPFHNFN